MNHLLRAIVLKFIPALAAAGAAGGAAAQTPPEIPHVVSPLQVESDQNGVNLVDGKITIDVPALAVPGAPHLSFDRIQNAAPYVSGHILPGGPDQSRVESYSIHGGGAASESFRCVDYDCISVTETGSTFVPNSNVYRQAGSGAVYHFNLQHAQTTGADQSMLYYASSIDYPNGETIGYSYQTATLIGDPIPGRLFYRPATVSTNLGYFISIAYQGNDFNADTVAWSTPQTVTLYASSAPTTPIRKLTYSADGGTITEYGGTDPNGRVYHCTGCANSLGTDLEVWAGSTQLPGEASPASQVASVSGANVVGSVTRDGVGWTYAYTNLQFEAGNALYDHLTVNGPNGFHQVYDVTQIPLSATSHRNVISRVTDSINRSTSYSYDGGFRPISITYPEGNSVSVGYDDFGNIISRTVHAKLGSGSDITETINFPTDTCANTGPPVLCYRPTWSRDGLGRQTDYAYNGAAGQLTEQIDPADASGVRRRTSIVYESSTGISRPSAMRICVNTGVSCTTSAPIQTLYDYTGRGSSPLPAAVSQYDVATGATLTAAYTYDPAGRLLSTDGPLAGSDDATYNRYDTYGRKTWEIGPAVSSTNQVRIARRFTYRDSDDKPLYVETGTIPNATSGTLTLPTRTDMTYDSRRYEIREAVSAGATTYSVTDKSYDDQGRLTCTAVRMNSAAWTAMPGACVRTTTSLTYGPDRITLNTYDAAGQLLQETRAYGITTANGFPATLQQNYATYTYSANGKRLSLTDANGNRAEMTWDGYDRQRRWIFPSPTTAGVANQADYEEYGYDAAGNRISLRKRDGSTLTYGYDNLNRMILKVVPSRAGLTSAQTRDVYYGYDLRNAQTFARFDSASGEGVTNVYDGFGRLTSTSINMAAVTRTLAYQYDVAGNRIRITHPDSQYFTTNYDAPGRLTALTENGVSRLTAGYNPAGLVASVSRGGTTSTFGYDDVNRLASLIHDLSGTGADVTWTQGFNPASQITSRTRSNDAYAWTGAVNVNRNYTRNGLNQYLAAGTATFAYDANGNLTSDGVNGFVYDVENRLVAASGGHVASLVYDPLGRLFEVAGGGATTRFLYDGDALVAEYNTSGAMLRRYVHGSNGAADDPLLWYEGATVTDATRHYLFADHQGSIVAMTDWAGTLTAIDSYDEWGIPGAGNQTQERFQYTGQAWLPELGMYYYKARIYSPTLGRFMQTDPIGYADQFNLYEYVGDDPVDHADPSGAQMVVIRPDGRRIVYVVPQKVHDYIVRRHGPNAATTRSHFRATPTRGDLARYASNAIPDAERSGRVLDEGPSRGTSYDGNADQIRGSENKITSAMNALFGVGSQGETDVRVVVNPLSGIGDPVVRAQAQTEAAAVARVMDAATGNRAPRPVEVRVITNIYPIPGP